MNATQKWALLFLLEIVWLLLVSALFMLVWNEELIKALEPGIIREINYTSALFMVIMVFLLFQPYGGFNIGSKCVDC